MCDMRMSNAKNIANTHHRILIVDDEVSMAMTLRDGLETLSDCKITVSTESNKALHELKRQSVDLLIVDYRMPGMNGIDLATQARRLRPDLEIVMLTGYSDEIPLKQANKLHIRHILSKPAKLADIRNVALISLKNA